MDSRSQTLIFVFIHYQKCRTYGFKKLDIFICIFTSECISLMDSTGWILIFCILMNIRNVMKNRNSKDVNKFAIFKITNRPRTMDFCINTIEQHGNGS